MSELIPVPTTPAIINAIYDAVGVRVTDLPATKDKVLTQLERLQLSKERTGEVTATRHCDGQIGC